MTGDPQHVMEALGRLFEEARTTLRTPSGLRPSHYRVIDSVPASGVITVTELAARVGMTKQGIGQFVTQLTGDGYLVTEIDPADRRVRLVRRTRRGQAAARRLTRVLADLEGTWAARVGDRRYREFRSVLDAIGREAGTPG